MIHFKKPKSVTLRKLMIHTSEVLRDMDQMVNSTTIASKHWLIEHLNIHGHQTARKKIMKFCDIIVIVMKYEYENMIHFPQNLVLCIIDMKSN